MINTLTNGALSCSISFSDDFAYYSKVYCPYGTETIRYAVKRFFTRSGKIRREFTTMSYRLRLSGKRRTNTRFAYFIPASLMELPGAWVRVCGYVDTKGVTITHVAILQEYPGMTEKTA